jgi:hypothetical protein
VNNCEQSASDFVGRDPQRIVEHLRVQRDRTPDSSAVIIDEHLARRFWPGADSVGRRIFSPNNIEELKQIGSNTRWLTVIGVARAALSQSSRLRACPSHRFR